MTDQKENTSIFEKLKCYNNKVVTIVANKRY